MCHKGYVSQELPYPYPNPATQPYPNPTLSTPRKQPS